MLHLLLLLPRLWNVPCSSYHSRMVLLQLPAHP
jgi:hypothetical protein